MGGRPHSYEPEQRTIGAAAVAARGGAARAGGLGDASSALAAAPEEWPRPGTFLKGNSVRHAPPTTGFSSNTSTWRWVAGQGVGWWTRQTCRRCVRAHDPELPHRRHQSQTACLGYVAQGFRAPPNRRCGGAPGGDPSAARHSLAARLPAAACVSELTPPPSAFPKGIANAGRRRAKQYSGCTCMPPHPIEIAPSGPAARAAAPPPAHCGRRLRMVACRGQVGGSLPGVDCQLLPGAHAEPRSTSAPRARQAHYPPCAIRHTPIIATSVCCAL